MIDQNILEFIKQIPKVELHLHLEGAIQPGTAIELMKRNQAPNAPQTVAELLDLYNFHDLTHFVQAMKIVSNHIRTLDDLHRVCTEMLSDLAQQNVRYVEFDCAMQKYLDLGIALPDLIAVLDNAMAEAEARYHLKSRLLVNLLRHHGAQKTETLVKDILDINHPRIVGIGLSGDETLYPQKDFQNTYNIALQGGLHRTVHAGEAVGPDSVWDAIRLLHAQRIDHGTRSFEDSSLMKFLVDTKIPLTQCLTSNYRLNVVSDLKHHPFFSFLQAGILVTLNTDDPQIFQSSLTREYELAALNFGISFAQIKQIVLNGVQASFLPDAEKKALAQEMNRQIDL